MKSLITTLLFATNVQKILYYFLARPKKQIYDREVSRQTRVSRAGANFALRELAESGLLLREKKGRMVFYSLQDQNPLVRQIKILQNILSLNPLLHAIQNQSIQVILFGSWAKGENLEESDIDLFILTRDKKTIEDKIYKYVTSLKLQPVIHTPQEWSKIEKENKVFANSVSQGIVLVRSYDP